MFELLEVADLFGSNERLIFMTKYGFNWGNRLTNNVVFKVAAEN